MDSAFEAVGCRGSGRLASPYLEPFDERVARRG